MQDVPDFEADGDPPLAAIQPLADDLAVGTAVDWGSAESSGLSDSHKAVLRQLRAIAEIADAHALLARQANVFVEAPAPPTEWPGELRTWGQLIVREHIGRGSFGDVYRAWDPRLDREVALKLLAPRTDDEPALATAVIGEGRALARVRHPNVVVVHGADRIAGRVGVWMEFIEGQTLAQRIAANGPLAPPEVVAIGVDVARALAAVHKAGLLHRDVKAQNVMCETGGRIVLTDFGTAVPHVDRDAPTGAAGTDGASAGTSASSSEPPRRASLAGTPLYLAPEVLEGAPQTPRSDIYALGVLLFHALTGSFPVTGRALRDVRARHRASLRTPLGDARQDLPPTLVDVVERALATDPTARFQSADEMASALEDVVRLPVVARSVETGVRSHEQAGAARSTPGHEAVGRDRHSGQTGRRATWAVAAVLLAVVAGTTAWLSPLRRATPSTTTGPDQVLVASFDHVVDDDGLARLAERAVVDALTRSRAFAPVARERVGKVLPLMRKATNAPIDSTNAREVAARDGGIRAVVEGSVSQAGSQQVLEASIVAPVTGTVVTVVREILSSAADAERATASLATRLVEALDASDGDLPSATARFEPVTTASFEALVAYTEARAAFDAASRPVDERGHLAGTPAVAEMFARVIALDPEFALAHTWLGWSLMESDAAAFDHFAKGAELASRASHEEWLWARGSLAYATKDNGAAPLLAELLRLQPLHYWALASLEDLQIHTNGSFDGVVEAWVAQAKVRPDDLETQARTATALLHYAPQAHRAWPYVERVKQLATGHPDEKNAAWHLAAALTAPTWDAWADGRTHEAVERLRAACDVRATGPRFLNAMHNTCLDLAVTLGRLRDAETHSAYLKLPNRRALIGSFRGDQQAVLDAWSMIRDLRGGTLRSWWALQVGVVDDGGDQGERFIEASPFQVRHFGELGRGPSPDTLALFERAWRPYPRVTDAMLKLTAAYAQALERAGQGIRAIEVLRTATLERRAVTDAWAAPQWLFDRGEYAELLRRLGRDAEAEPVERELLQLLSEADEDHVIAAKLRARYGGSAPAER